MQQKMAHSFDTKSRQQINAVFIFMSYTEQRTQTNVKLTTNQTKNIYQNVQIKTNKKGGRRSHSLNQ